MALWFSRDKKKRTATNDSETAPRTESAATAISEKPAVQIRSRNAPGQRAEPPKSTETELASAASRTLGAVAPPPGMAPEPLPPAPAAAQHSPKAIYKQLMSSFYDAIVITDNKGHIIDSNQRACEFFGIETADLWDKPVAQFVSGINETVFERIRRAIGNDRFVLLNTRCVRQNGSLFPAEVGISMVALLGQDDFVFTIRNVERRVTQVRNLRAGQNAFMNAQSGCFICDENGAITAANAAFLSLLDVPPKMTLTGTHIGSLLPGVTPMLERASSGETVAFEGENKNGDRTFSIQIAPNQQGARSIAGCVGSILPA